MDHIPLIIVEDHAFTRTGMQQVLDADGRFDVLGVASNAVETLAIARKTQPLLALTDYNLPDASGLEVVIELQRWVPSCACVVITGREDAAIVGPLLDAGARGILSKASPPEHICNALMRAVQGEQVLDRVFRTALSAQSQTVSLSPRELEVLIRIARGLSNPAIAKDLSLSVKTVESHRGSLMRKMDVSTTATLMVKAAKAGLIDL